MSRLGQRYQVIIMFLLSANSIPVVVNHLLMAFYAFPTRHNCRVSWWQLFAKKRGKRRALSPRVHLKLLCVLWPQKPPQGKHRKILFQCLTELPVACNVGNLCRLGGDGSTQRSIWRMDES